MGRGVSSGGGQSSLGYLFGSQEAANKPASKPQAARSQNQAEAANKPASKPQAAWSQNQAEAANTAPAPKTPVKPIDKEIPAGIHGNPTNNYYRAEGQNCGNFITDRPSTKVHSAPGGGSSLGYLFGSGPGGGGSNGN